MLNRGPLKKAITNMLGLLGRTSAFQEFLETLNQSSLEDSAPLTETEQALFVIALIRTFHDDIENPLVSRLIDFKLTRYRGEQLKPLRAFIPLFKIGLLTLENVKNILRFGAFGGETHDWNDVIMSDLVEARRLNQASLDLIFSAENYSDLLPNFGSGNLRAHLVLAKMYIALAAYASEEDFAALSCGQSKKLFKLKQALESWFLFASPLVKEALGRNIRYSIQIMELIAFLEETSAASKDARAFLTDRCMVAIFEVAKYEEFDRLLEFYENRDLLDHDRFIQLSEFMVRTQGNVKTLLYCLYHDELPLNLLMQNNIDRLAALFDSMFVVLPAICVLDYKRKLNQAVFDEMVASPQKALYIAARVIGFPQLRKMLELEESFCAQYPEAVSAIKSFVNLHTTMRFFVLPSLRQALPDVSSELCFPSELLMRLAEETGEPGEKIKEILAAVCTQLVDEAVSGHRPTIL